MNLRLALLGRTLVPLAKRWMLDELMRVTAEGFTTPAPEWVARSYAGRLDEYARFTARQAGTLVVARTGSEIEAAKARLSSGARLLGIRLRSILGVRGPDDAFAALRLLYRQIGIDISACPAGCEAEMCVGRCFFASYYNRRACRVVEALDQGLVAGLFDGARLEFSERLTDGSPCCRACIRPATARG